MKNKKSKWEAEEGESVVESASVCHVDVCVSVNLYFIDTCYCLI